MSSKFFSSRSEKNKDDKFNTKNAPSTRNNVKRQSGKPKSSGRGR
jgi:hypothetical protein